MFSFQIFDQIRRQSSWASCDFKTHHATSENFDATQLTDDIGTRKAILRLLRNSSYYE